MWVSNSKQHSSLPCTHSYFQLFSQEQQGEIAIITNLFNPSYKLEVASPVPSVGLVSLYATKNDSGSLLTWVIAVR